MPDERSGDLHKYFEESRKQELMKKMERHLDKGNNDCNICFNNSYTTAYALVYYPQDVNRFIESVEMSYNEAIKVLDNKTPDKRSKYKIKKVKIFYE